MAAISAMASCLTRGQNNKFLSVFALALSLIADYFQFLAFKILLFGSGRLHAKTSINIWNVTFKNEENRGPEVNTSQTK